MLSGCWRGNGTTSHDCYFRYCLEPLGADFAQLWEALYLADDRAGEIGGKRLFVLEEINPARFAVLLIQQPDLPYESRYIGDWLHHRLAYRSIFGRSHI